MKNILYTLILSLSLSFTFTLSAQSQSHQGLYMKLEFLDIDRDDISSFKSEIENVLKPVNEARIKAGALRYWYAYSVLYPGSQNSTHNFVIVTICDAICAFENIEDHLEGQLSAADLENLIPRFNNIMIPRFSELWRINNSMLRSEEAKPSRYFMLDYMRVRPGLEYTYQMMEDDNARPIHEYRIQNGNMEGWELFSLILPRGDAYGYNFATGNYFSHLRDVEFHFNEEVIRQSSPDVNVAEFIENVENVRELVRSEVLELVDYIN